MVRTATGRRGLVVLLHGFLGARLQMLPLAVALSSQYDVLNFGYRSRAAPLREHSEGLIDAVTTHLERQNVFPSSVNFVSHSFGGLVVHRAFAAGLGAVLGDHLSSARCVMIAPPVQGAALARAFHRDNVAGPQVVRDLVHGAARVVLGSHAGYELLMKDEQWFAAQLGRIPDQVQVLVVAGTGGRLNPLIADESDGIVGKAESILHRPHYRKELRLTHNLMLYSPSVISCIKDFLDGVEVGTLTKPPK
ncbi:hypothetical protein BWQ96_08775 [Gracilariopsis chorda]|uniref:AB hydrolase-1 domain-containing protein n=1 Tax=Gracilariopsis chorda TaxID=448386 RepID=A0A2V3IHI5_9FLOR|nr:hypothetical protein BWQ96_08775 [Gracilariopsis chorda]|eukprot:PXF41519.1 hypothetical protein BWQ96_08775 [Gracilariopsis chorda]